MKIDQETFERVVIATVDKLDAQHRHVRTVTGNGEPIAFHLGYAIVADALADALAANGITVDGAPEPASDQEIAMRNFGRTAVNYGLRVETVSQLFDDLKDADR